MSTLSRARGIGCRVLAALALCCAGSCGGGSPNCVIHCINTEPGHEATRSYAGDVDCFVCGVKLQGMIQEVCDLGPGDQCSCHADCG